MDPALHAEVQPGSCSQSPKLLAGRCSETVSSLLKPVTVISVQRTGVRVSSAGFVGSVGSVGLAGSTVGVVSSVTSFFALHSPQVTHLVVIAAIAAGFNAREFNVAGFHAAHFNASGVSILDPRGNRPFAADTDHSHNQYIRAIRVHAAIDEVAGDA